MSAPQTQNGDVFRALIEEGFNRGNLEALDNLVTPDFIEHQDGFDPPNLEGLKGAIRFLRTAFPDLTLIIEDMITDRDRVWARLKGRGTHLGPLMGFSPSGKRIEIDVIDICRMENGRLAEHWGVADRMHMLQQIGAMPAPPQGAQGKPAA